MIVFVINSGSSSLKYELFDLNTEDSLLSGAVTRIGMDGAEHTCTCAGEETTSKIEAPDHLSSIKIVMDNITKPEGAPIKTLSDIEAVAHRVGHGGSLNRVPVVIDQAVKDEIKNLIPLMPLHHPAMLTGIEVCQKFLPDIPHVAVFDTAFHRTIPEEAAIYGLPYAYYAKGIQKLGYHGNSHEYVALQAAQFLETPLRRLKIISCHLGNGASVCAIQQGQSIDTSMGFSPLQGLMMGTRTGDLDPGIIPYLMRNEGLEIDEIDNIINTESGLLGISGVSSDMREIIAAADQGNTRAHLAIKSYCYRVKQYIGAYTAVLGGADVLVFTGGIGENSVSERARCVQGLERLGFAVDHLRNERCIVRDDAPVFEIGAPYSNTAILVIATNEELMIARQCAKALDFKRSIKHDIHATDKRPIRVSISARHSHLSKSDLESLFGQGYELTEKSSLHLDEGFASHETVSLVGPRGRIDNVRVIGPLRDSTQFEISSTEGFKLGIDAPVRESGNLKGTPGATIEGPKGTITIPEGVIVAMRHIHMSTEDAVYSGVKDKDMVMVKVEGER